MSALETRCVSTMPIMENIADAILPTLGKETTASVSIISLFSFWDNVCDCYDESQICIPTPFHLRMMSVEREKRTVTSWHFAWRTQK